MHHSVRSAWHTFSEPLEGRVRSMYLDVRELITTGVGNLIDASQGGGPNPWTPALGLPWKHEATGALATSGEIRDAWLALKARPDLAKMHWKYAARLNDLRLDDEAIDALVMRVLEKNEIQLRKAYPAWDSWPADAQLGALSMSWAVGSGFPKKFPNFTRYANAGDWIAASVACKIATVIKIKDKDGNVIREIPNPGTKPRNMANELCFQNAETVVEYNLHRDVLWWPKEARREPATEPAPVDNRATLPEVKPIPLDVDWDELRAARDAEVQGKS